jgi:hypothetical protein
LTYAEITGGINDGMSLAHGSMPALSIVRRSNWLIFSNEREEL